MRKLLLVTAPLLALALSASPASAFWRHQFLHPQYVAPVAGAQGLWGDLATSLLSGFLGNLNFQPGLQPGSGNQGGQSSLTSVPVASDVAARLNDVDSTLTDIRKRSEALVPSKTVTRSNLKP